MVTGSNDVYVIKAANGGKEVMNPAIKEVVKEVDLIGKMMYIEPIRGLLADDEVDTREEEEEE
jgi:16S rRNA processing protein RimM